MLEMHGIGAAIETIKDGVKLTLKPKAPDQLAALRKNVREHVVRMSGGGGAQMMDMMQGMKGMMPGAATPQASPAPAPKPEPAKPESEVDHSEHHPQE